MITTLLLVTVLQGSQVAEPNTHVMFATELQAPQGVELLAGTGVRTRTMLHVKVYAFGLYLDSAGARANLGAWRSKSATDLAGDESLYQELLKGTFPMTLRLVMTRNVGGAQMAEAFDDALGPRVARAAEQGMPGGVEALAQFRGFFSDELASGAELLFSWAHDTLSVSIAGKAAGEIANGALCWALFDVYLGEKPITSDGKKTVIARLPEILGS